MTKKLLPLVLLIACTVRVAAGGVDRTEPFLMVDSGHWAVAYAAAFSANGRLLATAGDDKTIILWDVETGHELSVVGTTSAMIYLLTFVSGNTILASCSADGIVNVWDVDTGKHLKSFEAYKADPDQKWLGPSLHVRPFGFNRDGTTLAGGNYNGTVTLYDVRSGRRLRTIGEPGQPPEYVALSPNAQLVAVVNSFYQVRLLSTVPGKMHCSSVGEGEMFQSVTFNNDSSLVFTMTVQGVITAWRTRTCGKAFSLIAGQELQPNMAVSPDGTYLAAVNRIDDDVKDQERFNSSNVRIWSLKTDQEMNRLPGTSLFWGVSFSGNNLKLAAVGKGVSVWTTANFQQVTTFQRDVEQVESIAFDQNLQRLYMTTVNSREKRARAWDIQSRQKLETIVSIPAAQSVLMSANCCLVTEPTIDREAVLVREPRSGRIVARLSNSPYRWLLSSDASRMVANDSSGVVITDIYSGKSCRLADRADFWVISDDGSIVVTSTINAVIKVWRAADCGAQSEFVAQEGVDVLALSPDANVLAAGTWWGDVSFWDVNSGTRLDNGVSPWRSGSIKALAFGPHGLFVAAQEEGLAFWDITEIMFPRPLCYFVPFSDGSWAVADGTGRFDTDNLEESTDLHWVMPQDAQHRLSLDIFMRDYYEPKLLPRWQECKNVGQTDKKACEKEFKPVRPLVSLNRVQPLAEVKAEWMDDEKGLAKVLVKVSRNSDPTMKNGKTFTKPYDVRLFRDGQLVGWAPMTSVEWQLEPPPNGPDTAKNEEMDLQRWREKTEVKDLDPSGSKELPFVVQVPRRTDLKQVTFTAYAFNEDRVKSATASAVLPVDKPIKPRVGKAYVISVGVNRTESSPNWDLHYAANDARRMSKVVGDKLKATKQFSQVTRVRLVSDAPDKQEAGEAAATKVHLQAVLDVLAGRRTVNEQLKREIPDIAEVSKAEPEDVVLLAFSSHGYTDDRGVFHMVLWDIGKDTPQDKITPELQANSLSSDQLSGWLREVDAGEMVMVVDSCHSAATVEAEGFKPGPMGSRGLGQLAYDKGMRILAASKAKESAVERGDSEGKKVEHGLLSYALIEEGLVEGLADFQPKDGKILMGEWLAYGEQEVPKLFQEGDVKGVIQEKGGPDTAKEIYHGGKQTLPSYQQPVLFDFNKGSQQTTIVGP
jgi:WD40 repeat protein